MNRLRVRLVAAFLLVALLPVVPLTWLVRGLLDASFSTAYERDVTAALEAGVQESRARLRVERRAFADSLEAGWRDAIAAAGHVAIADGAAWKAGDVPPSGVFDPRTADDLARWARERSAERDAIGAPTEVVAGALAALVAGADGRTPVAVARALPESMAERADRMGRTLALLRRFRADRDRRIGSMLAPFLIGYALLLVIAIGVAVRLAGRIARPVEALAAGARRVAAGDLGTRVAGPASGEVGALVVEFNAMVAEIEARRREVARLERVAAWRDFARTLAHEIKNPLTPIQLAVQQLADRYPRDAAGGETAAGDAGAAARADGGYAALLDECVAIVGEEIETLRRLVREFSEFARLPKPKPVRGDLVRLLDELVRLYGEERVERTGASSVPARFDEAELRRAVINLVDNGLAACRAADRPERVVLEAASAPGGFATLVVRDGGCGIAPEHRERVFEPDFSTKSGGMGLGLAIVEGIVRAHEGSIAVESEPGRGTAFTIRLPAETPARPEGGTR